MFRQILFYVAFLSFCVSADILGFGTESQLSMEHLQEHFKNKVTMEKHDSPEDRQFYYFQIGDTNGDHLLDGIELFKMISGHSHDGDDEKKSHWDAEMIEVQVDQVLGEIDRNGDGTISFSEYSKKFAQG